MMELFSEGAIKALGGVSTTVLLFLVVVLVSFGAQKYIQVLLTITGRFTETIKEVTATVKDVVDTMRETAEKMIDKQDEAYARYDRSAAENRQAIALNQQSISEILNAVSRLQNTPPGGGPHE